MITDYRMMTLSDPPPPQRGAISLFPHPTPILSPFCIMFFFSLFRDIFRVSDVGATISVVTSD